MNKRRYWSSTNESNIKNLMKEFIITFGSEWYNAKLYKKSKEQIASSNDISQYLKLR